LGTEQEEAAMTVITISRQYGSLGDEIARRVCEILNYHYFDHDLILKAAVAAGISEDEIVDFSEDNYKVRNFLERLFGARQTTAHIRIWKKDAVGVRSRDVEELTESGSLELIQKAILYAHNLGEVVIVGRGGQVLLQNEPDVLHIRIEAPLETRLLRVRDDWRPDETRVDLRRTAQDLITEKDNASADFIRQFYGAEWDDPALYHVILNTGKVSVEQAADLIVLMAREIMPAQEGAPA